MILSDIMPDVLGRIEENLPTAASFPGPTFWKLVGEVYPQMVDAMFESTLMTGAVQSINQTFTITAGTTYFTNPKGMVAPLRLKAPYPIRKTSLAALDKMEPNWQKTPSARQIVAWFPLGTSGFGVWPQTIADMTVTMDWIVSPVNKARPYDGTETVPFQVEYADLIVMFAAASLRSKEAGQEAEEAAVVVQEYLERTKALSLYQARLDGLVFSGSYGGKLQVNPRATV